MAEFLISEQLSLAAAEAKAEHGRWRMRLASGPVALPALLSGYKRTLIWTHQYTNGCMWVMLDMLKDACLDQVRCWYGHVFELNGMTF